MNMHGILSARYADSEPEGGYPIDARVVAVHARYGEQSRRANDDIDGGGMLAFLADGGVIGPYVLPTVTVDDLLAYAASVRYAREVGGITVGGVPISTDRESQAMLTGAHSFVAANSEATIRWKSDAGFVTLDAAQITALALAVGAHVQACFAREADVTGLISASPPGITSKADVDAAFATIVTAY
jgi:hypothetical protein